MRRIGTLFILALLASRVGADEVKLKNNDRITGTVMEMSKGKVVVDTPYGGTIQVDWTQVESVSTEGKIKVKLATGEVIEGKLSAGAEGRLKIATEGAAQPVEVDPAKVTHFNESAVDWHGNINLAARETDGNTETTSFLFSAEGSRASEMDLFLIRTLFRYGKKEDDLQERNGYGLAKYQHRLYERLYAYASVELMSDRFKDLQLGTIFSVGLGYEILKSEAIDLSAEAGFAYYDNNFRDGADESHAGARVGAALRTTLPLGFEFRDIVTYYPNFEESDDWQLRNEATAGRSLGSGWTLNLGVITEYDHETLGDLEERDDTYFVGLGYVF